MFKFRSQPPSSLSDVYATCLSSYALGYPLWFPETHDTGMPQIGDVGYVEEGAFRRIFNINTTEEAHKVDFWMPPFVVSESLGRGIFRTEKRNAMLPGRYRSHGVRDTDIEALLSLYVTLSSTTPFCSLFVGMRVLCQCRWVPAPATRAMST